MSSFEEHTSHHNSFSINNPASILSIEGNIGSGKSTLLEKLKAVYKDDPKMVFLDEPVKCWNNIKDANGVTMLEKFYSDQDKYSFPFQMMAYISRLAVMKEAIAKNPDSVFITERCLYTDKYVFAKMLYDSGKIEDVNYQIYNTWFDTFITDFTIKKIIYVKTDPKVAHGRTQVRNRNGESSISLDYLGGCHTYHENMMVEMTKKDADVVTLDGNVNIYDNPDRLKEWIDIIDQEVVKMKS